MGAFLLVREFEKKFDSEAAVSVIRKQCGSVPIEFTVHGWKLWLFPKLLVENRNFREFENTLIFVTGTPVIGNLDYNEALDEIARRSGIVNPDYSDIGGLFALCILKKDKISILADKYSNYSLFHTATGNVFSSSFLSICAGLDVLTADRDSMTENLLTGSLTGSGTVFTEVRRIVASEPLRLQGVETINNKILPITCRQFKNRTESINYQLSVLNNWFSGFSKMVSVYGIRAGITGGLDSRLLFSLCRLNYPGENIEFYAHARKKRDRDFNIGKDICSRGGINFSFREVADIEDASSEEIRLRMDEGMYFNDGQVRSHSFWHEQFNSSDYVKDILDGALISLNGIGGEQYRNMERLMLKRLKINWVKDDLILRLCGWDAADKRTIGELAEKLAVRINRQVGDFGKFADLGFIKRYQNEVYNQANRTLRAVNENRLCFALAPFTDQTVSQASYCSIGELGFSIGFEAEMIKSIDPEIASLQSVYGFPFNKREPLSKSLPRIIFNNFIPFKLRNRLLNYNGWGRSDVWIRYTEKYEYLLKCSLKVKELNLPVRIEAIAGRTDLGPLVFALGHLLLQYGNKVNNDGY
jgi:hypothetical protein